jgi:hypothetical protein
VIRKATESLKLYNLDEMTPIRKLFGLPPPTQPPPAPTHTGRVGNKKPTQKTHPKKPPKKPTKNVFFYVVFLGFLKFLIFLRKYYKLFSLKQIFNEQIRHKLSFIYKTIPVVRYRMHSIKNISERKKINTQSRADA